MTDPKGSAARMGRGRPTPVCEDRVGHPRDRTPCEDRRPAEGVCASRAMAAGLWGPPRTAGRGDRQGDQLTDAELVTLAMMQAMPGFTSEARWLHHARSHLRHLFPCLPKQPGYNKRLYKSAGLLRQVTRLPATNTSAWSDDMWTMDSTPVECGRPRETAKHSDLGAWPAEPLGELLTGEPTTRAREPRFAQPCPQGGPCLLMVSAHRSRALFGRGHLYSEPVERHSVVHRRVTDDGVPHDLRQGGRLPAPQVTDVLADSRVVPGVVEQKAGACACRRGRSPSRSTPARGPRWQRHPGDGCGRAGDQRVLLMAVVVANAVEDSALAALAAESLWIVTLCDARQ
jgi:hypothetical protein